MAQKSVSGHVEVKQTELVTLSGGFKEFELPDTLRFKVSVKFMTSNHKHGFDEHIADSIYIRVNRVPMDNESDAEVRVRPIRAKTLYLGVPMSTYKQNPEYYIRKCITKELEEESKSNKKLKTLVRKYYIALKNGNTAESSNLKSQIHALTLPEFLRPGTKSLDETPDA